MTDGHIYIFDTNGRASDYGIGTYIEVLLSCIKTRKVKVTLIKLYMPIPEMTIEMKDGVRHIQIPKVQNTKPGRTREELIEADERYFKSLGLVLLPYIDLQENNIYHLNYTLNRPLAAILKKYFNAYIILTAHYTDWSFALNGNKRRLLQLLKKPEDELTLPERKIVFNYRKEADLFRNYCDLIIAIADHSYNDLKFLYQVPESKIRLIHNSIEDRNKSTDKSAVARQKANYRLEKNEIVIVFAGRLDEVKGVDLLLHAFDRVLRTHPQVHLVLAGDGLFNEWFKLVSTNWARISFTGFLSRQELSRLYAVADIGVMPSRHEEFGYVAIEMMMHALPVVATQTTGLSEIVQDGVTGFQVKLYKGSREYKTIGMLADKLSLLIENESLRRQMGGAGRALFLSKYELSLFREKMLSIYDSTFELKR